MTSREVLKTWVLEALEAHGGSASVLKVCKHIWLNHEAEIRESEKLLYTWQYDVRWAAQQLRDEGRMASVEGSRSRPWELSRITS